MDAVLRSGLSHGNRANFRESEGEQFQVLTEGVDSAGPTPELCTEGDESQGQRLYPGA